MHDTRATSRLACRQLPRPFFRGILCAQVVSVPVKNQAADNALIAEARKLVEAKQLPADYESDDPFAVALCIISDDRGFESMLQKARLAGWGTLAVCSERVLLGDLAPGSRGGQEDGAQWLGTPVRHDCAYPGAHVTLDFRTIQELARGVTEELQAPEIAHLQAEDEEDDEFPFSIEEFTRDDWDEVDYWVDNYQRDIALHSHWYWLDGITHGLQ